MAEEQLAPSEALPCPFCGRQPWIRPWHGGKPTKHAVSCANDYGCVANPGVTGETRRKAIDAWNVRGGVAVRVVNAKADGDTCR